MSDSPQAGLNETGLGRLDGLEKESLREEEYREEVESAGLAQRMAALTVNKYADRVDLGEGDREDLLTMLGLPREVVPPSPQERAQLSQSLPRLIHLDTRNPNDHVVPERPPCQKGHWAW